MYYTFTQAADLDLTPAATNRSLTSKRLLAWHVSATVAASVNLRDGGVGGPIVVQILCPANDIRYGVYANPGGLVFKDGLFVDVVAGTFVGSVDLI